jgi:sporulation-control protein spo0M
MREFLDTYYLTLRDLRLNDFMAAFARQVAARPTIESVRGLIERAGFEVRRVATDSFSLRYPDVQSFLRSPVIQTVHLSSWREIVPDLTLRRLVFNEVDRRLTARLSAAGGMLNVTVPMVCVSAVRL